jgi:hypothetical protein
MAIAAPAPAPDKPNDAMHLLQDFLLFFFSGLLLAAVAIILGGQWLANCLNIPRTPKALFRIPLPGFFTVEARGNEVGLGITGFVLTLLSIALPAGKEAYAIVKERIGVDLGQFNSLCVLSAFITLVWTFLIYLLLKRPWSGPDPLLEEQQRRLENISAETPLGEESADGNS